MKNRCPIESSMFYQGFFEAKIPWVSIGFRYPRLLMAQTAHGPLLTSAGAFAIAALAALFAFSCRWGCWEDLRWNKHSHGIDGPLISINYLQQWRCSIVVLDCQSLCPLMILMSLITSNTIITLVAPFIHTHFVLGASPISHLACPFTKNFGTFSNMHSDRLCI